MPIKNLLDNLQPREKALINGIDSLTDTELIAIFIGSGRKDFDVFQIANTILKTFKDFISLSKTTYNELMQVRGIGKVKAIEIIALFEISKRINNKIFSKINSIKHAAEHAAQYIQDNKQEHFMIVLLNYKNEIIYQKIIASGLEDELTLSPKLVLSEIIKRDGKRIYCFHNHPSGNAKPSTEDIKMTESLKYFCDLFNIDLLGHIVIVDKYTYHLIK